MRVRALVATLLLLLAPSLATAQVGSTTDIITGTVRNTDNRPVANARIEVMSVETGTTRVRTTNDKGQYTLLFPDGGGQYRVTARAIGLQPASVSLNRLADEDRLVADFRLSPTIASLGTVVVSARQTPRSNENQPTPGSTERALSGEQLMRLPVDASDPNAIAALSAGVVGLGGTDTSSAGFSVAGQRADQNLVTLDGLSFGGSVPSEAVRSTRVITSTYDIARGQFTGGQVATTTKGGTNDLSGSFAYTLRDPSLEFATGDNTGTTSFSGAYTQHQVSGGLGGPMARDRTFWFGSFQLRRRIDALQSLLGAGAQTLEALNVQPDSAARFLSLLGHYGLPLRNALVPDDRTTDNLTGIVRVDQQLTEAHSLSLRGTVSGSVLDGFRSSAQSVPTHAGEQKGGSVGGLVSLSSVMGQFLNEFKGSYALDTRGANPYLRLPEGRVLVGSTLSSGQTAITSLDFGGNGALPNDNASTQLEVTNETSWLSGGGKHRWKVGELINRSGFRTTAGANRSGNFQFLSLADLEANRPSQFTRSFAPAQRTGGAVTGAVYFGDIWRPNRAFQLTVGARAEGSGIDGQPAYNPDINAKFGLRTDRIPSDMRVSPRIGFTLTLGLPPDTGRRANRPGSAGGAGGEGRGEGRGGGQGGGRGGSFGGGGAGGGPAGMGGLMGALAGGNQQQAQIPQPWIVRGGIGDFRGRAPTQLFSSAIDATGLPGSETQLVCVGSAVPTPDWSAYLRDFGSIPAVCADGSGPGVPLSRTRPNVTAFARDFATPRSIRSSLGVSKRFLQRYNASVDASYSVGTGLYGVTDRNLVAAPQFVLTREGNRPVYVPAATIIPFSGVTTLAASRRHPEYGYVFEVASPLTSHTAQVTATLNGNSLRQLVWNLSYTFMRSTDQSSFSGGNASGGFSSPTTSGDPNVIAATTSDLERRHGLNGSLTWLARPWLDVTGILRVQSGQPFTPRVGGDINGDGARNDRAFVFSPASSGDSALANGMRRLLDIAPGGARACLEAQMGRVADRNSCRAPTTMSLDLQLNFRPQLGAAVGRRLQVQVGLVNPLAGLDQLLHGSDRLRGWGQPTFVDNTLLYVRGFDPATSSFRYAVNERFGSNALARSALRNPFQISLTARMQVGVDRQRQLLEGMLSAGSTTSGNRAGMDFRAMVRRLAPNPITPLMDLKDVMKLTQEQITKLKAIGDSLDAKTTALTKKVEDEMQQQLKSGGDLQTLFPRLQPVLQEARNNYLAATQSIQKVLTPEQWAEVPESVKNPSLRPGGRPGGQRPEGGDGAAGRRIP